MVTAFVRQTRRHGSGEARAKTEAETGGTQPQAQEGRGPPEAVRDKEGSSRRGFVGNMALETS